MLAKLRQIGSWLTGGEKSTLVKPSWGLLKEKLLETEKRLVELFSSPRTRFKFSIKSKFSSLDALDEFFLEIVDNLIKRDYAAIKADLASYHDVAPTVIELDDFLLTKDRRYIRGPILTERIRALIELIDKLNELNETNFDAKIIIDRYFTLVFEEYWQLYVNSMK